MCCVFKNLIGDTDDRCISKPIIKYVQSTSFFDTPFASKNVKILTSKIAQM